MPSARRVLVFQVLMGLVLLILVVSAASSSSAPVQSEAVPTATTAAVAAAMVTPLPDTATATAAPTATATRTPAPTATATATRTPAPTATATPLPTPGLEASFDPGYVPILMYHYVRTVDPAEDELGYNLSVSPELFDEQMAYLYKHGYTTVRMDRLADCLRGLARCPERAVALTFDDGYADAATTALPILRRYGFTATFYIVTEFVDRPGYMSWDDIRRLHASGMEIGSHTLTHPDLAARDSEVAYQEIAYSRAFIEKQLEAPVRSFSYPIGSYTPDIADMVRAAGYTNAVTVYPGANLEQMYELPRRRLLGGESLDALGWHLTEPAQ